jgi:hypothetical protein
MDADGEASDHAAHEDAIESLLNETHMPYELVRDTFYRVFVELKASARVEDFLILFAIRKAREALRSIQSPPSSNASSRDELAGGL